MRLSRLSDCKQGQSSLDRIVMGMPTYALRTVSEHLVFWNLSNLSVKYTPELGLLLLRGWGLEGGDR